MLKKINLNKTGIILSLVILFAAIQSAYAGDSFTVNVPNAQGTYTSLLIRKSGNGYIGPQGEFYAQFPSIAQLQVVYGLNGPNPTVVAGDSQTEVVVTIAPPALPVYVQPEPPAPDYMWTPGYWAYDPLAQDYYWVPGTWVRPPSVGLLWTPGYWYWRSDHYVYSDGYWGHHIGFYGGINYGHGYGGRGFSGGGWHNNVFVNRTVNVTNINVTINNTTSFNGGPGGIHAKATFAEKSAMKEKHIPPTSVQKVHMQGARKNPALRASVNHGKPAIAATAKPGVFKGKGVVSARKAGAFYNKTKPVRSNEATQHKKTAPHAAVHHKVKKPLPKKEIPSDTTATPKA